MKLHVLFVGAALVGACATDPARETTDDSALSITLPQPPDGIACISFTFADEDGVTTQVARAIANRIIVRDLAAGAYDLSAIAYSADPPVSDDDCAAAIPGNPPWGTEQAVPLIIEPGVPATASLTLVPTEKATITAVFAEPPTVVAFGQGALGNLAANGDLVAWLSPASGPNGQVMSLVVGPGAVPVQVAGGQTNVAEIVISDSGTIAWSNSPSGAHDDNGRVINDGSIWEQGPAGVIEVASGQSPSDIQFATDTIYWGDFATNSIQCGGCGVLAADQQGPNTVSAGGDQVFWNTTPDSTVHMMRPGDPAPTTLFVDPGHSFAAMGVDATNLYFNDFDTAFNSRLLAVPRNGGLVSVLADPVPGGFPIAALAGQVYLATGSQILAIPATGGAPVDLVDGDLPGAAVTVADGHHVLYWTDNTHGGLVWRGRLD